MKKPVTMYRCDGCDRGIQATSKDPVHMAGKKTLCTGCLGQADLKIEPKPTDRAKAARERWASMSVSERLERITKMQAGKAKR